VILAEAVVFWIIVAVLLRRDFSAVGQHRFKGGWKLAAGVAGLFVVQALVVLYVPGQSVLQLAALTLSQVALLGLVILNRHLPGAVLFAAGMILNITVMMANGGWMPITPELYAFIRPERAVALEARPPDSKGIILSKEDTNLWVLSDIVPVVLPWRRTAVSIGDLLLVAGTGQFVFHTTARKRVAQRKSLSAVEMGQATTEERLAGGGSGRV
jgi:hypothetical protein